jgi:hypothetical protein
MTFALMLTRIISYYLIPFVSVYFMLQALLALLVSACAARPMLQPTSFMSMV